MKLHNKIWLGIGLILAICLHSSCKKEAAPLKEKKDLGKVTLLKVISGSRVAPERQMADMRYIDDYEVEEVMVDSIESGRKLKKLIDNPSSYLTGEVMMQCTSSPEYYVSWAGAPDIVYGINTTSGCPMLFQLKYEGADLKILEGKHILSKKKKKFIKALKEIQ